uniref:Secreted protein n=1 Tax=Strongyloides venezuelensis TaxID=75913 RepID=A0A0K0G097_STRVS
MNRFFHKSPTMFVKFYLLGAALALMLLPIRSQGPLGQDLFSYVPDNIDRSTFMIDSEVEKPSDVVLIKYPDTGHKHGNISSEITTSDYVTKYKNLVSMNTSLGYKNPPYFNLPDYIENSTTNEIRKINVNDSSYYKKEESNEINLKLGNDIQFDRDEEISLSRMRYNRNGLINIENST